MRNPEEHAAGTQSGFIAQDVEAVFPNWVDEDKKGMKGIVLPPMEIAALEVESIRALRDRANKAEERLDRLERGTARAGQGPWMNNPALWGVLGVLIGAGLVSRKKKIEATA